MAPLAALNLGNLLAEQGEVDAAKTAYQRAIDSGHPEAAPRAAFNLGDLLAEQGEAKETIDYSHPHQLTAVVSPSMRPLSRRELEVDGVRYQLLVDSRDVIEVEITSEILRIGAEACPLKDIARVQIAKLANAQFKTVLRGPGRILRSGAPELVRQEIWGYLLTAWAVSALISDAAAAAWTDPGRVSFTKAVRILRRAVSPAFPPQQADGLLARAMTEMTRKRNLNPVRHRSSPRVVKRWRALRYPAKQPGHKTARHNGPPTIRLPNLQTPQPKDPVSTS